MEMRLARVLFLVVEVFLGYVSLTFARFKDRRPLLAAE
jgi:hypothetical protein